LPNKQGNGSAASSTELEELMYLYQQSDAAAVHLLVTKLSPQVFQFYLSHTRDKTQAEDLLQDFWLRLHRARHTYRPGEPVLPWVFAIARRVRIDDYRKRRRIFHHELQTEEIADVAAPTNDTQRLPELEKLLEALPTSQKEVILMLKVSGLSIEEVARATGSSIGSVKQKAHRAYEKLRALLGVPK
jgi:RNA polymerase sigma-70 factor, ECF subfamily